MSDVAFSAKQLKSHQVGVHPFAEERGGFFLCIPCIASQPITPHIDCRFGLIVIDIYVLHHRRDVTPHRRGAARLTAESNSLNFCFFLSTSETYGFLLRTFDARHQFVLRSDCCIYQFGGEVRSN